MSIHLTMHVYKSKQLRLRGRKRGPGRFSSHSSPFLPSRLFPPHSINPPFPPPPSFLHSTFLQKIPQKFLPKRETVSLGANRERQAGTPLSAGGLFWIANPIGGHPETATAASPTPRKRQFFGFCRDSLHYGTICSTFFKPAVLSFSRQIGVVNTAKRIGSGLLKERRSLFLG